MNRPFNFVQILLVWLCFISVVYQCNQFKLEFIFSWNRIIIFYYGHIFQVYHAFHEVYSDCRNNSGTIETGNGEDRLEFA